MHVRRCLQVVRVEVLWWTDFVAHCVVKEFGRQGKGRKRADGGLKICVTTQEAIEEELRVVCGE